MAVRELYHNDQKAFDYFCDMMYEYYEKRSPLLKEWDEAREAAPDWYKGNDMLGMLMYTNCLPRTSREFRTIWTTYKSAASTICT